MIFHVSILHVQLPVQPGHEDDAHGHGGELLSQLNKETATAENLTLADEEKTCPQLLEI